MRYIKKNLKQAHEAGVNAENVTSLPNPAWMGCEGGYANQQRRDIAGCLKRS